MKRYFIVSALMLWVGLPVVYQIGLVTFMSWTYSTPWGQLLSLIPCLLLWALFLWKARLPEAQWRRYLSLVVTIGYFLLIWIVPFGLGGYQYGSTAMLPFISLSPTFVVANFVFSFEGDPLGGLVCILLLYGSLLLVTPIFLARRKKKEGESQGGYRVEAVLSLALVFLVSVGVFQQLERQSLFLGELRKTYGTPTETGLSEEVDLDAYRPFQNSQLLSRPQEAPTRTFSQNWPKLDGATAFYPVYSSAAEFLYTGLNKDTVQGAVGCSKTAEAYRRLIDGEVDVIFVAEPSQGHLALAEAMGVTLSLTPIAKEAFVFFVQESNPVTSLTQEEIRGIYQKRITQWEEVGGTGGEIRPFQRPENSGSQTTMLSQVMQGATMAPPLREERVQGMGGIVTQVASYREGPNAIGYSFRWYATVMNARAGLKLLEVDGVAPDVAHIRSNSYPYTVNIYGVTRQGEETEETKALLDWFLSPQGQALVEQAGYVGIEP